MIKFDTEDLPCVYGRVVDGAFTHRHHWKTYVTIDGRVYLERGSDVHWAEPEINEQTDYSDFSDNNRLVFQQKELDGIIKMLQTLQERLKEEGG